MSPVDLDLAVAALKMAYEGVQRLALRRIANINKRLNALRPVHRLPPELFRIIIQYQLDPYRFRARSLWRLSSVSAFWWGALRDMPDLWSTVSDSDTPMEQRQEVTKSKGLPLDVEYHFKLFESTYHWRDYFARLLEERHRWRSLLLHSDSSTPIGNLLEKPVPQLESLAIKSYARPCGATLKLPSLASLASLQVDGFRISDCTVTPSTTLTELSLNTFLSHPSSPLLVTIAALPCLTKLCLQNQHDRHQDPAVVAAESYPLVEMHQLRSLILEQVSSYLAFNLLQRIKAPNLGTLHLLRILATPAEDFLLALISPTHGGTSFLETAVRQSRARGLCAKVPSRDHFLWIQSWESLLQPENRPSISVNLDFGTWNNLSTVLAKHSLFQFKTISPSFTRVRMSPTFFWDEDAIEDRDAWLLEHMDNVTHFDLVGHPAPLLLSRLSKPRDDGRWRCPKLVEISCDSAGDSRRPLGDMVQELELMNGGRTQVALPRIQLVDGKSGDILDVERGEFVTVTGD